MFLILPWWCVNATLHSFIYDLNSVDLQNSALSTLTTTTTKCGQGEFVQFKWMMICCAVLCTTQFTQSKSNIQTIQNQDQQNKCNEWDFSRKTKAKAEQNNKKRTVSFILFACYLRQFILFVILLKIPLKKLNSCNIE